jgi:hypothetical protein
MLVIMSVVSLVFIVAMQLIASAIEAGAMRERDQQDKKDPS